MEKNNTTKELLAFMRATEGFTEQEDTHGKRFHYSIDGRNVAYISFKYAWGGYKFMSHESSINEVLFSVDHLKLLIEKLK
jgi:hypothetical protein